MVSQALIDFKKEKKLLHLSNHTRTYDKYQSFLIVETFFRTLFGKMKANQSK